MTNLRDHWRDYYWQSKQIKSSHNINSPTVVTLFRMYGVTTGKKHTVIRVPTTEEGSVIKVALDPSGLYVAASVTDKTVLIFDIYMGECIAKLSGHSGTGIV